MQLTRRDFLRASIAIAGAMGVSSSGLLRVQEALARTGGLKVVWLAAQACTGCSVSILNSIYYTTIDDLLLNKLDLKYHPQLSAAAGQAAIDVANAAYNTGGYVLIVEGAVPTLQSGRSCYLWPGTTAQAGVTRFALRADAVLAVGTCASFGGIPGAAPNPTGAKPVKAFAGSKTVINIPGCPVHPDWLVGTVGYILKYGKVPPLDSYGRPTDFFGATVHSKCPNRPSYVGPNHHSRGRTCSDCHAIGTSTVRRGEDDEAGTLNPSQVPAFSLSQPNCVYALGCKGPVTNCDCPTRKWNGAAAATPGVNWCIGARSPCFGCTQPTFPDGMSPFYTAKASVATGGTSGTTSGTTTQRNTRVESDD
jgi:hydrogenase small subunit